ncbi:ComEC/Rec2 family competence protein [bacterium AH-315-G05]|nr:ComEC/Rec2 family competence protein [Alkaliphilus sp. AH-315-G20]MBN4069488.1 ComEC/Rec2 family competence protein [bacterium AH-315-G05]
MINNIKIIFNRPLVLLSFSLAIGIMFSRASGFIYEGSWILVLILLALLATLIFEKVTLLVIGILVAFLGSFLYGISLQSELISFDLTSNNTSIVAEVLSAPTTRRNKLEVDVKIKQIRKNDLITDINEKVKVKVNVNDEHEEKARRILSVGNFIRMNKVTNQNTLTYLDGYDLYLKSNNIHVVLEVNAEHVHLIKTENKYSFTSLSLTFKKYVEKFFDSTIQDPYNNVVKSVLFGNQGYMSKEMLANYSRSGTAHIIAVSGLHIGIIVIILGKILEFAGMNKNNRLLFTMLLLFFYAYTLNFPTSVVRAGAMYLLYVVSYFTNRRYDSVNTLFLIAFVVLLVGPLSLFSVSFQLSFMATFSILVFYPIIYNKLNKTPEVLKKLLAVSISAQIGTIPIIAYHFNQISIISLLANLLIVPTIGLLISLAIVSVMVSLMSFHIASLISLITNGLLIYIDLTVSKLAEMPFSSIEINDIRQIYIIIYYSILIALYCWSRYKSKTSRELDYV